MPSINLKQFVYPRMPKKLQMHIQNTYITYIRVVFVLFIDCKGNQIMLGQVKSTFKQPQSAENVVPGGTEVLLMDYSPDFPEEQERGCLIRLSRIRYEMAEGQPDAMGWRVADINGIEFGTITDLLADLMTGQIICAAITTDNTGKTALIPVEGVYLDMSRKLLIVPVTESEVRDSPDFDEDVVDLMPYVEYWASKIAA